MTLRGESIWRDVGAPASRQASERATGPSGVSAPAEADGDIGKSGSLEDLENEVYAARELHEDERGQVARLLADARAGMTDATYRRALMLARDSGLLSVEECLNGAAAMEWEPMPRPEFSLETIEAAVAEQERRDDAG